MIKSTLNKYLTKIPAFFNNLVAKLLVKTRIVINYQPVPYNTLSQRICADRLHVIKKNLYNCELCLDIGCNIGYFSKEISKSGIFTIGIDSELKNIIVAKSLYSAPNLVFKQFKLDKDSVKLLPRADIILFLSVFHHLVKDYGQHVTISIFKTLLSKCNKHFFFETGQATEVGTKWSGMMSFAEDIDSWARNLFINECGFKELKCLGEFDTFLTPIKRKLFVASR